MSAPHVLARIPVPRAWLSTWDRMSPREHRMVIAAATLVLAAIAWTWIWQAIQDDTVRARSDVQRDRAALAAARAQIEEMAGLQRVSQSAKTADPRVAVERVVAERGLKASLTSLDVKDNRTYVTFTAIEFDALVGVLDALAKADGLRPVEATLTPRIEPGTMRAEIALAR
jgi:type II secretory pathway component PulM